MIFPRLISALAPGCRKNTTPFFPFIRLTMQVDKMNKGKIGTAVVKNTLGGYFPKLIISLSCK